MNDKIYTLITDDPKSNLEMAFNLAYAKDGEVWLRGMGFDGNDCTLDDFGRARCFEQCGVDCEGSDYEPCFGEDPSSCYLGAFYAIATAAAEMRGFLLDKMEVGKCNMN